MSEKPDLRRVVIGVPCYGSAPAETLEDYMRFMYHLGRRYTDFEFFLKVIPKQEQFRARNSIIKDAITISAKYLLMLDDDMRIDTEGTVTASECYDFLRKLINHIEKDPTIGAVGALYFQRGGSYHPVCMHKKHDEYYWLQDSDLKGELQEVTVAGGGCLLINMAIIDSIPSPWFEPEQQSKGASNGTDIQICEKARAAGYKIMLDSSIEIGHVRNERAIITKKNRLAKAAEQLRITNKAQQQWDGAGMITLYSVDVEEYTKLKPSELEEMAEKYITYARENLPGYLSGKKDLRDYYRGSGLIQLARQYSFHRSTAYGTHHWLTALRDMAGAHERYGLDFGCGSAPLGFQLALDGNKMDFVDVDGAGGYEFVKWRAGKRGLNGKAGFEVKGPYDFILLMDIIEHLPDWEDKIRMLVDRLKPGGIIATNYFTLNDWDNPEHISMDKKAVKKLFLELELMPGNDLFWRKEFAGNA